MFSNPRPYILTGLIILLGSWFWQILKSDYYNSTEYYISLVESAIDKELTNSEYEMISVLDSASTVDFLEFSDYKFDTKYPFYIYRNGTLEIWSDNHITPDINKLNTKGNIDLLKLGESFYLLRKWHSDSKAGEFIIATLIPLQVDFLVQNRYLSDFTNPCIFKNLTVDISPDAQEGFLPVSLRGEEIFWVRNQPGVELERSPFLISLLVLYIIGVISVLTGTTIFVIKKSKEQGKGILLLYVLLVWLVLKLASYLFSFPESLISIDLFNSRFFAVSWFERSFGDMMLNTLVLFTIGIILFKHFRNPHDKLRRTRGINLVLGSVYVFLLFLVINYQYLQLRTIYFNSQLSLDITTSFSFDSFRIYALIVFMLIATTSAFYFHVLIKNIEVTHTTWKDRTIVIATGSVLYLLLTLIANLPIANLGLITLLLTLLLLLTGIHRSLQQAKLSATLYLLLWIIIEAGIGGWCIADFEKTRLTNNMTRYAQNLASKNDYMAEFMIDEVIESIKNDPSISARLSNPFLSKEYIINKITRGYLSNYLDKYSTSVYLYTHSGEGIPGFGTNQNYQNIVQRYALDYNKTEYEGLYVINNDIRSLTKHYMAFVPIERYQNIIGYIILDFRQRRLAPENVYPELLVDNRFAIYQGKEFSYAIFEHNMLIHSSGDMDYRFIDIELASNKKTWDQDGFRHYLLDDGNGDIVMVSREFQPVWKMVSNTSFLIIILLLPTILVLAFYLISKIRKGQEISYTAKIQVFLNLAFFIPLVLVTITTLSFITTSFREELIETRIMEATRLASQIEKETDAFLVDVTAKDVLTNKLVQLSSYGNFDATVFATDGQMITTTQPGIFSNQLQSGYLNHLAVKRIIEAEEASIVLDESIGSLNYYSTYSGIRSPETNRLLGVLGIPFFSARSTIEANQIEALNTLLNVFVLIFLLAVIGTFQTSKWLTAPLQLIRERLGMTSFSGENIPIEWHSDDEIGNLISDYNNMLVKLEESREALARSQKESAWREVAQQVAHEIKNPLTPMKLTLQKLEMAVQSDKPRENIEKTVANLLNQLQILNDIVTSFSEFAKMPIPRNEKMNLVKVIDELELLFSNQDHINLKLQIHDKEVLILADEKLMHRILSNIIINAGQSRKENQQTVDVTIVTRKIENAHAVQIEISDNGSGISNEVVDRVFIPKFSTKEEGSGIGLAVAKHGVENSGGAIWFETEINKGTTFYIKLPLFD